MVDNNQANKEKPRRAKARSGCLRCRAKRRKCDEVKPVCGRCKHKKENCQWGARIVFREENNHGVNTSQPFPRSKKPKRPAPGCFEIQDVTAEIIRDQQQRDSTESSPSTSLETIKSKDFLHTTGDTYPVFQDQVRAWQTATTMDLISAPLNDHPEMSEDCQQNLDATVAEATTELPLINDLSYVWPSPTALGMYDDSIFLPGSAYLDAHSTLRSHLIQEVHSSLATRVATPESLQDDKLEHHISSDGISRDMSAQVPVLTEEEEFRLLQNWVEEGEHQGPVILVLTKRLKLRPGWTSSTATDISNTPSR